MTDPILQIIYGYFTGLLTTLTPFVVKLLLNYKNHRRPFDRFWAPMFRGGLSIITAAEEKEPNVKSQVFDFMATNDAEQRFQNMFRDKYSRFTCDTVSANSVDRNLLLVGGPIPNTVTREILEQVEVRYGFEGNEIVDKTDSNGGRKAEIENQLVTRDYGTITKCRNPFRSDRDVIIVAGCFGWGTWAALKVLLDPKNLTFLSGKKAQHFQVIVSVRIFLKLPQEPIIEKDTFVALGG